MIRYRGRIITLTIMVVAETIFIYLGRISLSYIFITQMITLPILLVLSWYLGSMYDKLNYYFEENKKNKRHLEQTRDSLNAGIWSYDIHKKTVDVSMGIEKIFGFPMESYSKNPLIWKDIIHRDDVESVELHDQKLLNGEDSQVEFRIIREDDGIAWIKVHSASILDLKGKVTSVNSVIVDVTEQKNIEKKYNSSVQSYEQLVNLSPIGIMISQNKRIKYVNQATLKILGEKDEKKVIDKLLLEKIHPKFHKTFARRVKYLERNDTHKNLMYYEVFNSSGGVVPIEVISRKVTFNDEPAILAMLIDTTEKKDSEKKIKQLAYYDVLTGLPNKNALGFHFGNALNSLNKTDKEIGIVFLDLDRFKIINDTMGHGFGDIVLQRVAKQLNDIVGENGVICRYGGDEFAIILNDANHMEVTTTVNNIIAEFINPMKIRGQTFFTSASIGISMYPKDGVDIETLIKHAEIAMFTVKDKGTKKIEFYDVNLGDAVLKKMHLENDLRKAIENEEFILYYQPQIDLATEKLVGLEALIRWQHPERGLISPEKFISIAEETGLIIPIGEWVFRTACNQNKIWQKSGFDPIKIGINVSVIQFMDGKFIDFVKNTLEDTKLEHKYVDIEMTESIMQDLDKITDVINELKRMGMTLSLDDFGTGYSSLSSLRNLPIDVLKIDKSFVDEITTNYNGASMVKTIIDMGENLGMNVIAEGIETKEQLEFLKLNKCNLGQGYYYNRPLSTEGVTKILEVL